MVVVISKYEQLKMDSFLDVHAQSIRVMAEEVWFHRPIDEAIRCEEQSLRGYMRNYFFQKAGSVCLIWEEAGEYVSALRLEPYQDGLILSSLETRADYRRKGYGSALVSAAIEYAAGQKIYAHVSRRNRASMALHKKLGFRNVLDHAVYLDGDVSTSSVTLCHGV